MSKFQGNRMNPRKFSASQIKFYLVLIPLCLFTGLPILFIAINAFKPLDELNSFPPRFFVLNPTLDNFINLFKFAENGVSLSRYLFNSIVISVLTVLATIFLTTITGYALSKMKFKIKNIISEINTIALMFVSVAVAIPRYLIINGLGLIDTFWVHILPLLAMPVGLFLIKQFIDQIPNDLIEAARIDGASEFYIYRRVVIPIIKPAIATVAILSFQSVWNNVETSSIFTNSEEKYTLAYYLSILTQNANTVAGQGMQAAATLLLFLPNLVLFIIMQSKVMATMAYTGIKS